MPVGTHLLEIFTFLFIHIAQISGQNQDLFMSFEGMVNVHEFLEQSVSLQKYNCKRECVKRCLEFSCFGILINWSIKFDESCYVCNAAEVSTLNANQMNIAGNAIFYLLIRNSIEANASMGFDKNETDFTTNFINGNNLNGVMSSVVPSDFVEGKVNEGVHLKYPRYLRLDGQVTDCWLDWSYCDYQFTISFWYKPIGCTWGQIITTEVQSLTIVFSCTGGFAMWSSGEYRLSGAESGPHTAGSFYFVTATFDISVGMSMYVDGKTFFFN